MRLHFFTNSLYQGVNSRSIVIYTTQSPVAQTMVSMALIALLLYSITKANVKARKIFEIHIKLEMPRLSAVQREQAIGMLMGGVSQPAVARHFNVAKSTVLRLVRRLEETGSTRDRPRPGQPRVTTPNQDRRIRLIHLRDRFQSAVQTAAIIPGRHNPRISAKTVLRRLREHNIRPRRAFVGPVLDNRRQRVRRQWAVNNTGAAWPNRNWNRVVFSDESRFLLFHNDARQRVYRRPGERFYPPCVRPIDRFGGGSTMVWGAIRFGRKSRLLIIDGTLTARRYLDTILHGEILPYFNRNPRAILMHDNGRPHVAAACQDMLRDSNINVLPWPAYSADMNPIEHLWDILGRRVRARPV